MYFKRRKKRDILGTDTILNIQLSTFMNKYLKSHLFLSKSNVTFDILTQRLHGLKMVDHCTNFYIDTIFQIPNGRRKKTPKSCRHGLNFLHPPSYGNNLFFRTPKKKCFFFKNIFRYAYQQIQNVRPLVRMILRKKIKFLFPII